MLPELGAVLLLQHSLAFFDAIAVSVRERVKPLLSNIHLVSILLDLPFSVDLLNLVLQLELLHLPPFKFDFSEFVCFIVKLIDRVLLSMECILLVYKLSVLVVADFVLV